MNKECDIFLVAPVKGDSVLLRQLKIFQADFAPDPERDYCGFLGLTIPRLKAVAVVMHFRKNGLAAFSVPIDYRDSPRMSAEEARILSKSQGLASVGGVPNQNPMFYLFRGSSELETDEGGGLVAIDSLDGHEWTADEMAEYMYDFNNVI